MDSRTEKSAQFSSHLLNNLTSLAIYYPMSHSKWRKILEVPAQTLKHLFLDMDEHQDLAYSSAFQRLELPSLKVLELDGCSDFQLWMNIPSTSTLIFPNGECRIPTNIPSISAVWVPDLLGGCENIEKRCTL